MATITIKNIPDDLYDELKQAARAHHRSINGEVIYCIEQTIRRRQREDVAGLLEEIRAVRERNTRIYLTDEAIDEAIDEGRP